MLSAFESICKSKTSVYILKPCWEIVQSFKECLQQGKLVTPLEIFWINNDKTIIEFCFRVMWRISAVLEDLHNYSHPTQRNSVIAKSPNIKLSKIPSQVEQVFNLFWLQCSLLLVL